MISLGAVYSQGLWIILKREQFMMHILKGFCFGVCFFFEAFIKLFVIAEAKKKKIFFFVIENFLPF